MTSNAQVSNGAIAPNASRLLWAGFMAILAAGVGFALRGGIFDNWGAEFGFTATQLGTIGGAGFTGFCFGIIVGGLICDKIGYGKLVILAFACHVLSAFVTFAATNQGNAYQMLLWGMFIFAYANGTLEAVANPLVVTLYPNNRTHYLNILHASWPAGMILGAFAGWILDDAMQVHWKIQLALYLIPTVAYGLMFFRQHMPKSEASEKGASLGEMFKDVGLLGALVVCYLLSLFFAGNIGMPQWAAYVLAGVLLVAVGVITKGSVGSFLLFGLFVAHALVGAVELGTDGWIQNITGNLFTSGQGKALFLWTSIIMFSLRFCAHWIERNLKLSPVGLLLACSVLSVVGLQLASVMQTFTMALIALGIYAVGKTFFWPTMLAVASDRFPRTGAVAISIMGGIGMLSAGLIGGPGLGYGKDRFAADALQATNPAVYSEVKTKDPSKFLIFAPVNAIDGKKLAEAKEAKQRTPAQQAVVSADQTGDRKTLKADSFIPAAMALIYLAMLLYFKGIGGYKAVHLEGTSAAAVKS
ncbi:MAG: MFS transporter [Verrucomicrobia bacterium]|nr:MFS transporter [Verrucomicrobiota bacterium]